ncbi:MAG: DNA polymerase III subunit delta [Candidatus Margulisbacteria bacterium]|jgi:DNA polymerase-3 subunit delta|nr:DNA polymerase III subunit delta [Candidatus Margulisiibacteriota bacterium]
MADANLYLIGGEEQFLVEQTARALQKKHIDPALVAFALDIISPEEKDLNRIINSLQTIPTFSPTRLVLVRDPFFLKSGKKKKNAETDDAEAGAAETEKTAPDERAETRLFAALENLPDGVSAAFIINGPVDQRRKFFKFFQKNGETKIFEPFKPWEQDKAADWLSNYLREKNCAIDRTAAEFLVATTGLSLGALANEADKLLVYASGKNKLNIQDVQALASAGGLQAYALGEALRRKDLPEILRLTSTLLKDGEAPQKLLGYIAGQLRVLLQIKELQAQRLNTNEIAGLLKINTWNLEKNILPPLQKHDYQKLKNTYCALQNADYQIKTGQLAADKALLCALAELA